MKTFGTPMVTPEGVTFRPWILEEVDRGVVTRSEVGYDISSTGRVMVNDEGDDPDFPEQGDIRIVPSGSAMGEDFGNGNAFVYFNGDNQADQHFAWRFESARNVTTYTVMGVYLDGEVVATGTIEGKHEVDGGNGSVFAGTWAEHVEATNVDEAERIAVARRMVGVTL